MIKVNKRAAVVGAGSMAVVGVVTCDDPARIQYPNGPSQGVPGTIPGKVDNPSCDVEPVEDLGHGGTVGGSGCVGGDQRRWRLTGS